MYPGKQYFFKFLGFKFVVILLMTVAFTVSASTTNISLGFSSLPSSQGWTYSTGSAIPDMAVFSVNGTSLFQNTVGQGYSGFSYLQSNVVDPVAPFSISVTVRVTSYEVQSLNNPWGFSIGVGTGNEVYDLGIAPGNIRSSGTSGEGYLFSTTVDVTQFHEYRIEAIPGQNFELFIDNVSYGTAPPNVSPYPNTIFVGDSTAGANANVEVIAFSFVQNIDDCFINAPDSVNEGTAFTATVQCDNVNNVYGFQLDTSSSGDATTSATSYTPGSFVTDVGGDYLEASNILSDYSVSRRAPATATSGSFTLGSIDFIANTALVANGSVTLSINNLLLGDISGAPINVPIVNTTSVTIFDLLTLNLTVASDGTVQQVRDVTASVDTETRGPQTNLGTNLILNFTDVIETPAPVLTADMKSHLVCSGALNLTASVTDQTIHLKAGDVVLNGADVSPTINLFDAVTIGLAFGGVGTDEEDVNGDGTVNIFDLIHVGRNYGAVSGSCS